MSDYPILVERLEASVALRIVCEDCAAEVDITPEAMNNDCLFGCPKSCGGWATYKYIEADHKCPNCDKLGFFREPLAPCCSRVCQLQTEYAKQLAKR